MSLTLNDILNRFPTWVNNITDSITLHDDGTWVGSTVPNVLMVHNSSGFPLGYIHKDKTRCIYNSFVFDNHVNELETIEFLSYFKYKHILTLKGSSNSTNYMYVLQEILNE